MRDLVIIVLLILIGVMGGTIISLRHRLAFSEPAACNCCPACPGPKIDTGSLPPR